MRSYRKPQEVYLLVMVGNSVNGPKLASQRLTESLTVLLGLLVEQFRSRLGHVLFIQMHVLFVYWEMGHLALMGWNTTQRSVIKCPLSHLLETMRVGMLKFRFKSSSLVRRECSAVNYSR